MTILSYTAVFTSDSLLAGCEHRQEVRFAGTDAALQFKADLLKIQREEGFIKSSFGSDYTVEDFKVEEF